MNPAYGCSSGSVSIDELFSRYEKAGFLYAAKKCRLLPFESSIRENWRMSLESTTCIHKIFSFEQSNGAFASISSWMSSNQGWTSQHIVSNAGPLATKNVVLASARSVIDRGVDQSHQSWFQRKNRYAQLTFGGVVEKLSPSECSVLDYSLMSFPKLASKSNCLHDSKQPDEEEQQLIVNLVQEARSSAYCTAESLDDIDLVCVDRFYQAAQLRRYRKVHTISSKKSRGLAGCALVYRGPLGLNFSFLENRCDLVIDPRLDSDECEYVAKSLLAKVHGSYDDFEPDYIPLVVNVSHRKLIESLGGTHVRDYAQAIWLRSGFERWYEHVESVYSRFQRKGN